jgi:hypothetical protein
MFASNFDVVSFYAVNFSLTFLDSLIVLTESSLALEDSFLTAKLSA